MYTLLNTGNNSGLKTWYNLGIKLLK